MSPYGQTLDPSMAFIWWIKKKFLPHTLAHITSSLHGRRQSAHSDALKEVSAVVRENWEICINEVWFPSQQKSEEKSGLDKLLVCCCGNMWWIVWMLSHCLCQLHPSLLCVQTAGPLHQGLTLMRCGTDISHSGSCNWCFWAWLWYF